MQYPELFSLDVSSFHSMTYLKETIPGIIFSPFLIVITKQGISAFQHLQNYAYLNFLSATWTNLSRKSSFSK